MFAYKREYNEKTLISINNFYDKEVEVALDIDYVENYKCVITNYENRKLESKMVLKPYESIAFIN